MEKISDEPIRLEKVKRLKDKILKEIDDALKSSRKELKYCLEEGTDEELETVISMMSSVYKLRRYVTEEGTFMGFISRYDDKDKVVYKVPILSIDIWLQEKFKFVNSFLSKVKTEGLIVEMVLNDDYFGRNFTSVIESTIYRNKMEVSMNNIHDKVFSCPRCGNRTLYPVNGNNDIVGIGYHELCICDECGAELYTEPQYNYSVKFVELEEDEIII